MIRIGITQRVEQLTDPHERRDCLDQTWIQLLWQIGCLPIPIANHVKDVSLWIDMLGIDGILLSGGNDLAILPESINVAPERDATEKHLLEVAAERDIPVFGVCRGLQVMATHYGSQLSHVKNHIATPHSITIRENQRLKLSDRDMVNSFHGYGIQANHLAQDIISLATAPDGTVEAIIHSTRRQAAVMWHPERDPNDPRDLEMIRTFFNA